MRIRPLPFWTVCLVLLAAVGAGSTLWRSNQTPPPMVAQSATATTSTTAREVPFRVVKGYPHDTTAFTQGLLWHDGKLIEGTGREGHSQLRRVDLNTGRVLQKQKLPDDVFGEGVALAGDRLVQISWQNGRAFEFDAKTFSKIGEWKYDGQGWGLTFDGSHFIMSDGSDKLTYRDAQTFAAVKTLAVTFNGKPLRELNELEWIDGEIWANVWRTDYIVRIDPATGAVGSYLDCRGLLPSQTRSGGEDVLNGIAYDAQQQRIFITGKLWPRLFEIAPSKSDR